MRFPAPLVAASLVVALPATAAADPVVVIDPTAPPPAPTVPPGALGGVAVQAPPPPPADANPQAPPPPAPATGLPATTGPRPPSATNAYGVEIFAVDAAAIGAGLGGFAIQERGNARQSRRINALGAAETGLMTVGAIGAPLVHLAHQNPSSAILSFQFRAVYAPLLAYGGAFFYCLPKDLKNCWTEGLQGSNAILLGVTSLVDAVALARSTTRPATRSTATPLGGTPVGKPGDPTTFAPAPAERWYGWQTALVDAGALGLAAGIAFSTDFKDKQGTHYSDTLDLGMAYAILSLPGGPVVHLAHGNPGRAIASAGVRFVLPAGAAMYGALAFCSTSGVVSKCLDQGAQGGVLVGALAAAAFDAAVLAQPGSALPSAPAPALVGAKRPRFVAAPSFQALPGGGVLQVAGSF